MAEDPFISVFETFTLTAVVLSFIIFTRLALKAKSLGSFRFQLCAFLLVWVIAEIPHILDTLGIISVSEYDPLGLTLHAISMTLFALFVGVRSYRFLRMPSPDLPGVSPFLSSPSFPPKLGEREG